jgi:ABC-type nitrate/sulfonate/bicarbonate transport system substrate-binding protein
MANLEWERDRFSAMTDRLHAQSATDWITEHPDAAVERLFALLEQNQAAIAALAQAWRHTRRALELTQADLAYTRRALATERLIQGRLPADEASPDPHAAA